MCCVSSRKVQGIFRCIYLPPFQAFDGRHLLICLLHSMQEMICAQIALIRSQLWRLRRCHWPIAPSALLPPRLPVPRRSSPLIVQNKVPTLHQKCSALPVIDSFTPRQAIDDTTKSGGSYQGFAIVTIDATCPKVAVTTNGTTPSCSASITTAESEVFAPHWA